MFLLIDKPKGITSHDVVDRLRSITGKKKIGHGGTLDPNATGLLIVGIGRDSTKKLAKISQKKDKTYIAQIVLGEERDTDDVEGVVLSKAKGYLPPSEKEVNSVLKSFVGKQKQIPPSYSAVKIKGRKAYEIARQGEEVLLKKKDIEIFFIKLIKYRYPSLEAQITASSGTYIRSIARDLGRKLGCGAYLNDLRRTRIGEYKVEDAVGINFLSDDNWNKFIVNID